MSDFITGYNPDVLSCLANLSNDEVFTPPEVANAMLDMLPQELFSDPNTRFLDPSCKSGVFLREIAKRLIVGLADLIPDLQERIDHIFHKQLYGIAITELTSLLTRRSLYCSKYPNSDYSVSRFDNQSGNIRFKRIQHRWKNGKCIFCGASEKEYGGESRIGIENYAYELLHTSKPEEIIKVKFDVVIGNPPYQLSDGSGGSTDSAMPIYNKFIQQAKKLNPQYLCMIVPSKWMVGGRGLDAFRREMQEDSHLRIIHDFENAAECFPGLHLDGGVCYFLREKTYSGDPEYTYHANDGHVTTSTHSLSNNYSQYVIRDNRIISILEKTKDEKRFSEIVSSTKPFGIRKYLFNEPNRYPDANLQTSPFPNSVKIYGVVGIKGGAKRTSGYIKQNVISGRVDAVEKYKIFFTTSYSTNAVLPPESILAGPGEVCTETFLIIGPFNDEETQKRCNDYMKTRFFRFLLYYGKGTMQVNRSVFDIIPLQDFSTDWSDEKLYKYYCLTEEEICLINSLFEKRG